MTQTVADWLVAFLERQGIEFVFSHPGGPVLPIYESMRKSSRPRNILVRHEGAGSFMAEAYAKLTGRVGVCLSTMGPGAANMTIGVGTAMSDSTPLIAITGQMSLANLGRGYQQETDHLALFKGITKGTFQLNSSRSAPEVIERAYSLAVSGRRGPVHIDAPVDITGAGLDNPSEPRPIVQKSSGPAAHDDVVAASKLIGESSAPVILAGGGVIAGNAADQLKAFAEAIGCPVATSYNGRGSIPEDHPLCLGRVGEYTPSYSRRLISDADLFLAIGYRFTDVSLDGWKIRSDAKIIQIDSDAQQLHKNADVTVALLGDAGATLGSMLVEMRKTGTLPTRTKSWIQQVRTAREQWRKAYSKVESSDSVPIKPQRVMKEMAEVMGRDAILVSGAGRAKMWAASMLPIFAPRTWIHSGGYAVMGYEVPAAFASKLARPGSKVFSVGGDASFQMHSQELATAVEHEAPFVSVVLNDIALGSIRNAQVKKYSEVFGTEFQLDVNLASVAKAAGADGERVTKPGDLKGALERGSVSEKPYVIDVLVDGGEVPTFEY